MQQHWHITTHNPIQQPQEATVKLSTFLNKFSDTITESDGWVVPCPAHADGSPSLRVALNEGNDLLLHCRAGCTKHSVLAALDGMGVPTAQLFDVQVDDVGARKISATQHAGPTPTMVALARGYVMSTNSRLLTEETPLQSMAVRYLRDRFGITEDDIKALKLGLDPGGSSHTLTWRAPAFSRVPRIVVPFTGFDGVIRGLQGRALEDDKVRWCGLANDDDGTWAKFGFFSSGSGTDTVIITEGPGDALTAVAAGYDAVFIRGAALGGCIDEMRDELKDRNVVVAGDNDAAGTTFNEAVQEHMPHAKRMVLPAGIGDLSDWRSEVPEFFTELLGEAVRAATAGGPPTPPAPTEGEDEDDDADEYSLTELGLALRLRDRFDGGLRYTPEAGFMLYNGVTWAADPFNGVRASLQDMLLEMETQAKADKAAAQAAEVPDPDANRMLAFMKTSMTSRGIDSVLKETKALRDVACTLEDFDSHEELLAFRNAIVNLRTGETVPASKELLITRQLAVDYTPDAPAPVWEQFLVDVFPHHPDMPEYLQRLIGYGITGATDEQCFVVLHGTGANGKSVFTETLSEVFKAVCETTPFSTFEAKASGGIPNDLAALKGARLVMASEGESGKPMAEGLLKRVTGRDQIAARFMRQEFFTFRPSFLLFLASNHKPRFQGQDEGLWRRVKLISWERYFKPHERDHQIWKKLLEESEGIAAWAVRGAMAWYAAGSLADPKTVVAATSNYRATADALAGFFPGVMVLSPGDEILGNDAFQAYVEWTEAEHLPLKERWTRRTFYAAMEERGVERTSVRSGQVLNGVKILQDHENINPIGGK